MSDLLDKARRLLELSEAATPGPWNKSIDVAPPPGCCVADAGLDAEGVHQWVFAHGGKRGTSIEDASLIAESRSIAPDLAAFVLAVNQYLASESIGPSLRASFAREMRECLGLTPPATPPTTGEVP